MWLLRGLLSVREGSSMNSWEMACWRVLSPRSPNFQSIPWRVNEETTHLIETIFPVCVQAHASVAGLCMLSLKRAKEMQLHKPHCVQPVGYQSHALKRFGSGNDTVCTIMIHYASSRTHSQNVGGYLLQCDGTFSRTYRNTFQIIPPHSFQMVIHTLGCQESGRNKTLATDFAGSAITRGWIEGRCGQWVCKTAAQLGDIVKSRHVEVTRRKSLPI